MATATAAIWPRRAAGQQTVKDPLPPLLQTPRGLALLELQGIINLPAPEDEEETQQRQDVPVGRLVFPEYSAEALDPDNTRWMRRVYLYVGQHQRLAGEVKKLPRPIAVIRRRENSGDVASGQAQDSIVDELEVVEIVKYKLVFSQRPEPVGTM